MSIPRTHLPEPRYTTERAAPDLALARAHWDPSERPIVTGRPTQLANVHAEQAHDLAVERRVARALGLSPRQVARNNRQLKQARSSVWRGLNTP